MIKGKNRLFFAAIRIIIAVGLLIYMAVSNKIDWSTLEGLISLWPITLLAILFFLMNVVANAWRLRIILKPSGFNLSFGASTKLTMVGLFFNTSLPGATGGDMVKIYYITKGNAGKRTELTTLLLLDRAIGMFALVMWPLFVIPFFFSFVKSILPIQTLLIISGFIVVTLSVIIVFVFAKDITDFRLLSWIFRRIPFGSYAARVFKTIHDFKYNKITLLYAVLVSLLIHTLNVIVTSLVAMAVNPSGFVGSMLLVIPMGFLANALPITPGGLGVGEAAFDRLFSIAGFGGGAEVLLGWRILLIVVGMPGLFFYLQGRQAYAEIPRAAKTTMEQDLFVNNSGALSDSTTHK